MIRYLKRLIKRRFCKHKNISFVRNIYGDEINHISLRKVYRSWWKCSDCGFYIPKGKLVETESEKEWRSKNWDKVVPK